MAENQKSTQAQSISQSISQFGIELDAFQAEQRKLQRTYFLNVIYIPSMRLLGYILVSVVVFLHNRYLLPGMGDVPALWFAGISTLHGLVSWIILFLFFSRSKFIHLGDLFLWLDFVIFGLGVYCSGGDKSWLFMIMMIRAGDQNVTTLKRTTIFAAGGWVSYLVLMGYLELVEHRQVNWPGEFTKALFMIAASFNAVMIARMSERLRISVTSAIRMARGFIQEMRHQTEELELARASLEKLYLREQEVTRTLTELNQMKTNFLIVTSHEMRTPLTVIKGYNEALLNQFFGSLSDAQKKSLEACQHVVDRLTMTLEDILEMLKINEGHIALKLRTFELIELITQVSQDFVPFLEKRHQHLSFEPVDRVDLHADQEKIHLILLNLLQNAIKFTPDGGKITIQVQMEAPNVHILISDTGIGVESSEIEKIFDKFYINDDPSYHTSGKFQFMARGTGLGLSIAKSYVEAHGGKIWAESQGRGHGSCFHVILPLNQEKNDE
ncbi:MAG TPA: HAMP domain-containing sensor histidine kinase [Acidobacteriota bacterium]|nr:HAMP domain-containing sensor histidine kinase [Acidobacteriota bacterium]